MNGLARMDDLFDATAGDEVPLPPDLAALYGRLRFPAPGGRPHVVGNFVTTLDGVVSLGIPGRAGGRPISGSNPHDRLVMGLLRAVADAVVVGAGTYRASSGRRWTAERAYPPLAAAYRSLRAALGKPAHPLNVVVTARGDLDLRRPADLPEAPPVRIVTTDEGASRLHDRGLPPAVGVAAVTGAGPLSARAVLDAVGRDHRADLILVEAGPQLMGDFLAERCLDELFLTVAPQVAGRDGSVPRPGLVAGKRFAPDDPRWATLVGLKRAGSHLFLRYALATTPGVPARPLPRS
jgi:riboflavin biosynthesis pyrimidine reductase